MIRMEIACFFVVAFIAVIYFSAKREHTKMHKCFAALLCVSMVHLVFDAITIYTVNNRDIVPSAANDIFHRLFIGTMLIFFYLVYYYIVLIVEEAEEEPHSSLFGKIFLVIALLGVIFLPFEYIDTPNGSYSYGMPIFMLYIFVIIYLFMIVTMLYSHWDIINPKKKMAICIAFVIVIINWAYQAVHPLALVSGMAVMLINLAFYLTMENPDIDLLEQVQKEKKKADEANAAKSIFLSHMSHEIRTPMNAIVGMSEILLRTDISDEQREYLNNIKSSGNALVSIVNDILDISKIEAGKMELVEGPYDLMSMLSDIRMIIKNRINDKPIELIIDVDENVPGKLYGDGLRIRQVIINLMNNAVKFTEDGYVKLSVKLQEMSEDNIKIYIAVSDTGQGIKQEDLGRLFDAFEQADTVKNRGKEGTGLGLTISNEFIKMMGGNLEVKSVYGEGTEFYFTISQKIATGMEVQNDSDADCTDFMAPEAKILIVDDNEMNLKVAVGLLAPLQMQIDVADSAKKAYAMVRKKRYDIIFMDHMMPVTDGVEATKFIRKMEEDYYKQVPIIALTANAIKESEKLFADAGMNDVVTKPIDIRRISGVILKWLPDELIIRKKTDAKENCGDGTVQAIKETVEYKNTGEFEDIKDVDVAAGIRNSGGRELFVSLLGDFYKLIDMKSGKIEKCLADEMIRDYTIEVHALKSAARMIGAMELSKEFEELENLGNNQDLELMAEKTPAVLSHYRSYKEILKKYGELHEEDKRQATSEELVMYLQGICDSMEGFDLDAADEAMLKLEECKLPEECRKLMENLRVYIADVDMENIIKTAQEMIDIIGR